MNAIKKVFIGILIIIIVLCTVFYSYYAIENGAVVFAEDIHYMSDEELEAAYQAYLQSKGGGLIGNVGARFAYTNGKMLNFLTSDANTTPFNNINEIKGLMKWQKSELESGNSSVLQLSMSPGGASVFSLYTQWLLQNHYFGNASLNNNGMFEDGTNDNLYNGKYDDKTQSLIWVYNGNTVGWTEYPAETILQRGSLIANGITLKNLYDSGQDGFSFPNNLGGVRLTRTQENANTIYYSTSISGSMSNQVVYYNEVSQNWYPRPYSSGCIIMYNTSNYTYSGGSYAIRVGKNGQGTFETIVSQTGKISTGSNFNPVNVNINFNTNNNNNVSVYPTINEGDNLYITPKVDVGVDGEVNYQPYVINEGDTISNVVNNYYTDSGTTDKTITIPSDDPAEDGGGGGSSDNPSGGTPPDWSHNFPHLTPDGEGGFNFNFTLPDLNIDWNISGLSEKFPFSIPFDLVSFCRILDADPVTPHFDGDIVLPLLTYHFDFNFERFDGLAQLVRNLEFIGFCIGLILITRSMIKG